MFYIAVDGPSGAGKSSVAKKIAEYFKIMYLDTGALYRAIGHYFIKNQLNYNGEEVVNKILDEISLNVKFINNKQRVLINDYDVTDKIRTNEVSMAASVISSMPKTRQFLLESQRKIARKNSIVMDGRDIGTVVLPDAEVKIFLTASLEERAKRRFKELKKSDENIKYEEVLRLIEQRDFNDTHRKEAPLKPANDAVIFDSTNYNLEQVVSNLTDIIKEKIK